MPSCAEGSVSAPPCAEGSVQGQGEGELRLSVLRGVCNGVRLPAWQGVCWGAPLRVEESVQAHAVYASLSRRECE